MSALADPAREVVLECGDDEAGLRLDRWLAEKLDLSRSRVQQLIDEGRVRMGGEPARKSTALRVGDRIEVVIPAPRPVSMEPEDIPLSIPYEDDMLLVVDKPAGMVVHPAPGHPGGTLVNALLHHIPDLAGIGGELRPGIVHRLDKDTSGLLVVAKSGRVHQALSDDLRARKVKREYIAVTWGHLRESPMTIDEPIGRSSRDRKRMAVAKDGRPSITQVRVRERWLAADLLDVRLRTGRTHQIRVHLAHLGHPVVGDGVYGAGWERGIGGNARGWARTLAARMGRQFLHAAELAFDHPGTGERMRFTSPLPNDLSEVASWARMER